DLQMNLGDVSEPPVVNVEAGLRDVDLLIRPGELPLTGVTGDLAYSTARGLSAANLTANLWGRPLLADINQGGVDQLAPDANYDPKVSPVQVSLQGNVEVAAISEWQKLSQLAFAQGTAAVDALVTIQPGEVPLLTGKTELVGVALELPEPFDKPPEQALPLSFSLPLGAEAMVLSLNADYALQLALDLSGGGLSGASLAFGADSIPVSPDRLLVGGHAGLVDEAQWRDFIDRYFGMGTADSVAGEELPSNGIALEIEALRVERLRVWGQEFSDVLLSLRQDGPGAPWWLAAENSWFKGELDLSPEMASGSLDIERVNIAGLNNLSGSEQAEPGPPLQLPDLAVSIAALSNDQLLLGELDFQLSTEGETLWARDITADIGGLLLTPEAPGVFSWQQGVPARSQLAAKFNFADLGEVFASLDYQRVLESRKGTLKLDLEWPGGPQNFSLPDSQGEVLLKAREGRFLDAPEGASGTLRVVSLLNFAGVVRRLSLSHMFESGVPFDSVDAEAHLHGGTLEVDAINVKGASSGFRFSGLIDLDNDPEPQTVDGELVVTLPVANNLPWVAALAVGLPVAAGVFVVSKVFEKQVNRFSSGVYKITGNLDDPEVEFDRVFDSASAPVLISEATDPNAPDEKARANEPQADETSAELPEPGVAKSVGKEAELNRE
ncbi:MAG: AsmA-like C-terminal region-containing protein, partial [Halieaceae bacterium]